MQHLQILPKFCFFFIVTFDKWRMCKTNQSADRKFALRAQSEILDWMGIHGLTDDAFTRPLNAMKMLTYRVRLPSSMSRIHSFWYTSVGDANYPLNGCFVWPKPSCDLESMQWVTWTLLTVQPVLTKSIWNEICVFYNRRSDYFFQLEFTDKMFCFN